MSAHGWAVARSWVTDGVGTYTDYLHRSVDTDWWSFRVTPDTLVIVKDEVEAVAIVLRCEDDPIATGGADGVYFKLVPVDERGCPMGAWV